MGDDSSANIPTMKGCATKQERPEEAPSAPRPQDTASSWQKAEAPLPLPRPRCNFTHQSSSVLFLNTWSCRFLVEGSIQASKTLSPRAQTYSLRGQKQTLIFSQYDIWLMFKIPLQNFVRHQRGHTIHLLRHTTSTNMCPIVRLCKSVSASTT